MYKDIGGKIKGIVGTISVVGIMLCIGFGFIFVLGGLYTEFEYLSRVAVIGGLALGIGGSLLIWLFSLSAYAFGQLVENSDEQTAILKKLVAHNEAKENTTDAE